MLELRQRGDAVDRRPARARRARRSWRSCRRRPAAGPDAPVVCGACSHWAGPRLLPLARGSGRASALRSAATNLSARWRAPPLNCWPIPSCSRPSWDLTPWSTATRRTACSASSTRRWSASARLLRPPTPARVAELDAAGLAARRCTSWRRSTSWSARPAPTRRCASPPTPPTPTRGALLQLVQERATEIETKLLFFELEWAALPDERAEELLADEALELLRPPPAQRSPLPPASADRARGEDPHREVDRQPERLGAAVRGAGGGAARRRSMTSELPLDVALGRLQAPDREVRASGRRGGVRQRSRRACARARSSTTRSSHDKAVEDRLRAYPHWLARATSPTRHPTSR